MQSVPGDLTTSTRPPTTIPLWHFLVALVFLLTGAALALLWELGGPVPGSGFGGIAVAHLLLIGWVCVTILGAMTQFVPVWSGVELHSNRLASLQLVLVAVGVTGFAAALWIGRPLDAVGFAGAMVAGFAVFVYNLARTLWRARPFDVTERHFALSLGFFALAVALGGVLAADYRWGLIVASRIPRSAVVDAHVTLAVFGGVLTTVVGALYQLGPMFAQTDTSVLDDRLAAVETTLYPVGVLALSAGRLFEHALVATAGGLLVATGVLLAGVVLGRHLRNATATASPMLSRYAVVAVAAVAWSLTAAATWLTAPLGVRFGDPAVGSLLLGALVGFVVMGTVYHVVPFIVWLERYSDLVGLEPVPAIDDLYDGRVATIDFAMTVSGTALLVGAAVLPLGEYLSSVRALAGGLLLTGISLFVANQVVTLVRHGSSLLVGSPEQGETGTSGQ